MTLDEIMRDIQALREDLLVFERKYGAPTEVFSKPISGGKSRMIQHGYWIGANGQPLNNCFRTGWPLMTMAHAVCWSRPRLPTCLS